MTKFISITILFLMFLSSAALPQTEVRGRSELDPLFLANGGQPISIIARVAQNAPLIQQLGAANAVTETVSDTISFAGKIGVFARRLGTTDLVVMEADAAQIDQFVQAGLIVEVELNANFLPHLASAAPVVNAPFVFGQSARGAGAMIVVIDSGVEANHATFGGRVVEEACFSGRDGGSQSVCPGGAISASGPNTGAPCPANVNGCAHGTHVAGIAAGQATGMRGIAPEASIAAIQAGSIFPGTNPLCGGNACVLFNSADLIEAMNYVANVLSGRHSIAAVNMSLGGGKYAACPGSFLARQIDELARRQIASVISSGNDGHTNGVGSPGCTPSAITVGGTNDADNAYIRSNSAPILDLLAPGVSVTSSVPGGAAATFTGTSMSAPMVSGAFAVLQGYFSPGSLTIETTLEQTGVSAPTLDPNLRKPRIDLKAAFQKLVSLAPTGPDAWMKDTWNDNGYEPDVATNGMAMSASPFVWVRQQADCLTQQHKHQNPVSGPGNIACVKLLNRGSLQANGRLEVYINKANVDVGAGWDLLAAADMSVLSHATSIAELVLKPLPGPGHYCLLVRWVDESEYVGGSPPPLNLPGGLVAAVKNDNDLIWRNVDIISVGAPKPNTKAVYYESAPGGTVNLVVKITALNSEQFAELGRLLIKLGYDPAKILAEPTSTYYQAEGPFLIVPLKPGVYYIPDAKIPLTDVEGVVPFLDLNFETNPTAATGQPLLQVEVATVESIEKHKLGLEEPTAAVTYVLE